MQVLVIVVQLLEFTENCVQKRVGGSGSQKPLIPFS
jgi:hypothetical protein